MSSLSYLVTVSRAHFLPAQMLLLTLRRKTSAPIVVVGNLGGTEAAALEALGAHYIDEDDIDLSGRFPTIDWERKHREVGWYKQMFLRLSVDRYMTTEQVVVLDSEVFVFDSWDESRLYAPDGRPKSFFWTPAVRKPDWDYMMYEGAAYLLEPLPECEGVRSYAASDAYKRRISGVVLFSTANVSQLWSRLGEATDVAARVDQLFNREPDLMFSDHDFYGLAVEYGLFESTVPTASANELLGWYDNHDDTEFDRVTRDPMWSMCQRYASFAEPLRYRDFMEETAARLGRSLPPRPTYWNDADIELLDQVDDSAGTPAYFDRYRRQLDFTLRRRFEEMKRAVELVVDASRAKGRGPTIVEIGTMRDDNKGGGHATYKFGELCSRVGGEVHTVDISADAIAYSRRASSEFQPWIHHHLSDSTAFLRSFEGEIDLLYLDGLDALPGHERRAARKQLEEIKAAMPHLAERCVVLLDDADLPHGGKTRLSSRYLERHGFRLESRDYQLLYARDEVRSRRWLGTLAIKR